MMTGFNSHYVITNHNGSSITIPTKNAYDELVVSQECQICPAFLLELEPFQDHTNLKDWIVDSVV